MKVAHHTTRSAQKVHDRRLAIVLIMAAIGLVLVSLLLTHAVGTGCLVVIPTAAVSIMIVVLDLARVISNRR